MLLAIVTCLVGYLVYYIINVFIFRPKISNYGNRYVFISNCDSSFGNALTKRLDKLGFNVYAGCVSKELQKCLEHSTSERVKTVSLDVSRVESIEEAFEFVKSDIPDGRGLWGLVNTAHSENPPKIGPIEWLTRQHYLNALEVNLFGLIDTTRIFLPLLKREKGRIVNASSTAGLLSQAGSAAYNVSQYGVEAFSDSVRRQLKGSGICVSLMEPVAFQTDVDEGLWACFAKFYREQPKHIREEWGPEYYDNVVMDLKEDYPSPYPVVSHVVDAYEHALTAKRPRTRYLVGIEARFRMRPLSLLPTWVTDIALMSPF